MVLTVTLALGVALSLFVAESSCQKFIQPTFRPLVPNNRPRLILPTYRPPPIKQILRFAREAGEFTPPTKEDVTVSPLVYLNLNRIARSLDSPGAKRGGGSHSTSSGSRNTGATHPGYNRRNARSVDSPSARRGGGSPRTSSGSRNTGKTHPGYNRRNAREIRLPGHYNLLRPKPIFPQPTFPVPAPQIPILARSARDIQVAGVKKPTHRDVIIPNWNPNVRTNPLNRGEGRRGRSLSSPSAKRGGGSARTSSGSRNTEPTHAGYNGRNAREIRLPGHLNPLRPKPLYPRPMVPAPIPRNPILARTARDIQIPGVKKPTHRDVIIPNWNPHVRTSPWDKIGGRHRRNLDDVEAMLGPGSHERKTRGIHVSGLPEMKKPTYRDVVIPNWNPHVRTNPWDSLGGRGHH